MQTANSGKWTGGLKMSGEEEKQFGQIKIKVDHSLTELKERERADKAERELDELRKKDFERRKSQLPFRMQASANEQSIDSLEQLAKDEAESKKNASGSVALNKTEGGRYLDPEDDPSLEMRRGFSDYGEMAQFLVEKAKADPNGVEHAVLNKLMVRTLNSLSDKPTCYSLESSLVDALNGKGKFKLKTPSDSKQEDLELAS